MIAETWGSNYVYYFYDAAGLPTHFNYNGTIYGYAKNLQGDIVGIVNSYGVCGYYTYDAWGKLLDYDAVASAEYSALTANALRYRGYYYDTETGLYYVSSRYYDPEVGRFINADTTDVLTATPGALTDKNLYAYCDNNPVMREDKDGQFWHFIIGAVGGH